MASDEWLVYMIQASDKSLYTGITTDMERRWLQHRGGTGGARYFRGRKPEKLVYVEPADDRSHASQREAAIKKLHRRAKLVLIDSAQNCLGDYAYLDLET